MKVEKVTLPVLAALILTSGSVAIAGPASALDPYAYIAAPTKADREKQAEKKFKKFKGKKKLEVAKERPIQSAPAKTAAKPATVIISASSPKVEEEKPVAKAQTAPESSESSGFLAGIKQSTGGIAKSTKAVSSGMINGSKSVGSKLASGLKSAGTKVKDSTALAGEKMAVVPKKLGDAGAKVKDGGSDMGGKIAGGFKSAGGALASIPKAMGGAAGKVSDSAGGAAGGAKKLAAAPLAGFSALGHGINKLNPFNKDESNKVAAKPQEKNSPKENKIAAKPDKQAAQETDSQAEEPAENLAESSSESSKTSGQIPDKNVLASENTAEGAGKAQENQDSKKVAKAEEPAKAKESEKKKSEKIAEKGGIKKKLAFSPKAGLGATKASIGAIGNSVGKLNPFARKDNKVLGPTTATAKKPAESVKPGDSQNPDTNTAPASETKIGERIQPEEGTQSTAAGPGAIPQ